MVLSHPFKILIWMNRVKIKVYFFTFLHHKIKSLIVFGSLIQVAAPNWAKSCFCCMNNDGFRILVTITK